MNQFESFYENLAAPSSNERVSGEHIIFTSELYHFGHEGMRWYQHIFGKEDSRAKYSKNTKPKPVLKKYQNRDGSLTEKGRAKYVKIRDQGGKLTEEDTEAYKKSMVKALRSGNAKEITKFKEDLDRPEIEEAIKRINTYTNLEDAERWQTSGLRKLERATKSLAIINDATTAGLNTYKNYRRIKNIINGRPIEEGVGGGKKKDKD